MKDCFIGTPKGCLPSREAQCEVRQMLLATSSPRWPRITVKVGNSSNNPLPISRSAWIPVSTEKPHGGPSSQGCPS